ALVAQRSISDTLWVANGNHIHNTNSGRVGIGINNPTGKVTIQGDTSNVLFEVRDKDGNPVFIVYQDSVHVFVSNANSKTNKGTFAVSSKAQTKTGTNTIFRVVPDSIVEIKDGQGLPVFQAFEDSVLVYVDASGSKTNKGTFAVSSKAQTKNNTQYLRITPDSSRVYTEDPNAGFGVRDLSSGSATSYMQLTPENYFIGHEAGKNNTNGLYNIFLGYNSGFNNVNGTYNVFLGYKTGLNNTNSTHCTFLGYEAGKFNNSHNNTFIGSEAGKNHQGGESNVFIGSGAGKNDSIGSWNIFIGNNAGFANKLGSSNVFLGVGSGAFNYNGYNNVFLGNLTGYYNNNGYENVFIGDMCGYKNTTGHNNIFIGSDAGHNNQSGKFNIFLGTNCGVAHNKGDANVYIGYECGYFSDSSEYNVGIGYWTLRNNKSGKSNVAIGHEALYNNKGFGNTALGYRSLISLDSSIYNVGIGPFSGWNLKVGNHNVIIGAWAYANNDTCYSTVCIGNGAMHKSEGIHNVALGSGALFWNKGNENTAIGANAFSSSNQTNYSNSTAIGNEATITASNQIRLGNLNVLSIGGFQPWSVLSDKRFKTDIKENVPGLDFILKLRPVTYRLNVNEVNNFLQLPDSLRNRESEKTRTQIVESGFIAQEVEEIAKQLGYEFNGIDKPKNQHDFYSLRYSVFVVPMVKAIQEQQKIIEQQQKEINQLKQEVLNLKNKLK
ncbi:MAG: tail fiber domain-containing protein, partial [Bacteroidales bacterium]|nr:tail fiber domain-containing protein [Bacteroidales bacterium]